MGDLCVTGARRKVQGPGFPAESGIQVVRFGGSAFRVGF